MKENKLVSIIIPTYNDSENLTEAIDSCINQTYKHIEILVCDDGSKDATPKVVKKYIEKYPSKVKYYQLRHSESPAITRNIGIKNSSGEFISFLDSDDLMIENKTEQQVNFLVNNPSIDIVCGNAIKFNHIKNELFYKSYPFEEMISFKKLLENNKIINSTILMRKSVTKDIGFLHEKKFYLKDTRSFFYEDYEYWLRALLFKKNISYSSEVVLKYRININGISQNSSEKKRAAGLINTLMILLKTKGIGTKERIIILNKILFYKQLLCKIKIKKILKK